MSCLLSLMVETFYELERDLSDDGYNSPTFRKVSEFVGYFRLRPGRVVRDESGKETVITGEIIAVKNTNLTSEIKYEEYRYKIISRLEVKNALSGEVDHFVYSVVKGRKYDEAETKID